jgi:hypothetical protein
MSSLMLALVGISTVIERTIGGAAHRDCRDADEKSARIHVQIWSPHDDPDDDDDLSDQILKIQK